MAEGGNPVDPGPTAPESLGDLFTNPSFENTGEGAAGPIPTVPQPQWVFLQINQFHLWFHLLHLQLQPLVTKTLVLFPK